MVCRPDCPGLSLARGSAQPELLDNVWVKEKKSWLLTHRLFSEIYPWFCICLLPASMLEAAGSWLALHLL